jgi:serine/threonine protein kinase
MQKYKEMSFLGKGGSGEVLLVKNRSTNEIKALKKIHPRSKK